VEVKTLGTTGVQIPVLGLGTWRIGGLSNSNSGNDETDIQAIRLGLELGMRFVDTAEMYGRGHSEEVVAEAIKDQRESIFLATKVSGEHLAYDDVLRSCEASLKRLRTRYLDLYQIHWPEPDEDVEEGWAALAKLKEEGKVRWIGVSNFKTSQLERCNAIAPVTSLQPPYSAISPEAETEILPYCLQKRIGVIVYSPMKSGLLTGKMTRERIANFPADDFRKKAINFQEPLLSRNLALAELLRNIGACHGRSAGEVAIAWTLRHPAVTAAIVGMRSPEQAKEVLGAMEFRLTEAEIAEIAAFC